MVRTLMIRCKNGLTSKCQRQRVDPNYIANALNELDATASKPTTKIVWLGKNNATDYFTQSKKGNSREMASLSFITKKETQQVKVNKEQGRVARSYAAEIIYQQPENIYTAGSKR